MNWYTEADVHTSDEADYRNNEWDRAFSTECIYRLM